MNQKALDTRFTRRFPRLPSQISISADGSCTAVAFPNGAVTLIDSDGGVIWEHNLGSRATSIEMTPDGKYIYTSTKDGLVVIDRAGSEVRRIKEHVQNAVLSEDGKFAFLGATDATKRVSSVSFYDAAKKALLKRQPGAVVWKEKFDDAYHFFAGACDGSKLVLGFSRRILCIDSDQKVLLDHKTTSTIRGLAVLPDASAVFFSTFDGHVNSLQMDGSQTYLSEAEEEIDVIDCDATGEWILATSKAKPLLFLFDRDGKLAWRFTVPRRAIHVRLADDATFFAVVCANDELLVCNNYYVDPEKRVERALELINDRDYSSISLNALARSSILGLTALINAVKDDTVSESSHKLIGKFPDELLAHFVKAVVSDENPDRLFRCLSVFYPRALPFLLQNLDELSKAERDSFYRRLAISAAGAQNARLYDLLGLLHLRVGELEPAVKRFYEAVWMPDSPEKATDHLKETLEALKQSKSTESIDQLFTTFA